MEYEEIGYRVEDGIATITLNRPEKLNAYTTRMRVETLDAFDRIDADDDVRVVVVTGAGRAFCAGADLSSGAGTFDYDQAPEMFGGDERLQDGTPRDGGGTVVLRTASCLKPVIGAINGPAVGVGVTMTLPMHVRIASDKARFGFVFARRGIVTEAASSWYLPRIVGISQAMEWAMTGRVFPASEALAGGLVSRVVPHEELLPAAYELAREVAENTSAVAVASIRRRMYAGMSAETPWQAHANDSRLMTALGAAADAGEGIESFLAKRPPAFPMKVSSDLPKAVPDFPRRRED